MQGTHAFDPKARTAIDLESFVADDHFLRKVHRVLEISFVRQLTASCYAAGLGRPSIDPEVYFRMLLVAYLYGITSDRRLCEEVRYNLAYRWFCRLSLEDEVPDHSSLSRIRDRYGEKIFEAAFRRIVELCREKSLVAQECRVMTDATLIAANAALNSLVHNDPKEAQQEAVTQRQDRGLKDSSLARRVTNQTHTSRTDPEATLAQKEGTPRQLKYKVHQSIDADSRVILDAEVTTGARHDNQPYLGQLQRIRDRYQIAIREATADRGYGSAAIIRALQEAGTTTYIPLWSGRVGNSKYLKGELTYDKERDRFRCPRGKYLTPNPAICGNYKRYVSSSDDCQPCPRRGTCPTEARKKFPSKRYVRRTLDQDLFEEVQARMEEPEFRAKLSERMWKVEGLFAEAKQNHGLGRARYRGRSKVQIQVYLSAMAQNLKRLVFLFCLWLPTRHPHSRARPAQDQNQPARRRDFFNRPLPFGEPCRKPTLDETPAAAGRPYRARRWTDASDCRRHRGTWPRRKTSPELPETGTQTAARRMGGRTVSQTVHLRDVSRRTGF
jgi:transposase